MTRILRATIWLALWGGVMPVLCSQTAPVMSAETKLHIAHVRAGLLPPVILAGDTHAGHSIEERMAALHVPGLSIAVIHHGAIEWAQGFGVMNIGGPPVTADTLFQAGSISKPVSALATLKLVEMKKLSLDADINTELRSWKLPNSPAAKGKFVTLRELLTHTGGTTVHGFPGYASDAPVPTLVQVLNGAKPANTPAILIETEPGTKWNYSGGGITIMQQAMIDVSHTAFPKLLHDTVLAPIGMMHSTFEQPLPADWKSHAAIPYLANGDPVPGGAHAYPEMAAAGLWTTASDLARYAIEVQKSLVGQANHVLSKESTIQMLTPGMGNWGLGIQIGGSRAKPFFTHNGVDEGFEADLFAYEDGEGAVVMTNAQGGGRLAREVIRAIAVEYGWPDWQPVAHTSIVADPKALATYIGTYNLAPDFDEVITLENGRLMAQATQQDKFPLTPESDTKFFFTVVDAEIEFIKDDKGKISALILHQNGADHKATRTK